MLHFVIAVNLLLGFAITVAVYPIVGVGDLLFNTLMVLLGHESGFGNFLIGLHMKHWSKQANEVVFRHKRLLMSVVCLCISLKIGAAIAIYIEFGAALLITFSILVAAGYFFDGASSGMTVGLSYNIARLVVKLVSFLTIGVDKVAEWIARIELKILGIEI